MSRTRRFRGDVPKSKAERNIFHHQHVKSLKEGFERYQAKRQQYIAKMRKDNDG